MIHANLKTLPTATLIPTLHINNYIHDELPIKLANTTLKYLLFLVTAFEAVKSAFCALVHSANAIRLMALILTSPYVCYFQCIVTVAIYTRFYSATTNSFCFYSFIHWDHGLNMAPTLGYMWFFMYILYLIIMDILYSFIMYCFILDKRHWFVQDKIYWHLQDKIY